MKIALNGIDRDVDDATSVQALLVAQGYGERRVAVEVNREIVSRSQYATRMLLAGDRIEIVHAIGGG
jgi:sulfur carrier protein